MTREADTAELARFATERHGRIDILVNTAGVIGPIETPAQDVMLDDFQHVLDVNVTGTFLAAKAVILAMIAEKSGRIVNIAGTSGLRGYQNRVAYSVSKWAVRGITRTLALELGQYGITVNDVCPNVTEGGRMDTIVQAKAQRVGKPLRRSTRTLPRKRLSGGSSRLATSRRRCCSSLPIAPATSPGAASWWTVAGMPERRDDRMTAARTYPSA